MSHQRETLTVEWRGRERYTHTWQRQLALHQQRRERTGGDYLVLVEHEPVITLGRQGDLANLLVRKEQLQAAGIDFHQVERGGDITYHGPGQLVGYPVISLREQGLSVREFMRNLEEVIIRALKHYGLKAHRASGLTGVWCGDGKIAALGVAIKGGVSYHGLALNVATKLEYFEMIIPCGLTNQNVTSISVLCDAPIALAEVRGLLVEHFVDVFQYTRLIEA